MRILYFSSRDCWPLTTGARIRDYHLAKHLAKRSQLSYVGLYPQEGPEPPRLPESGFEQLLFRREKSYSKGNLLRGLWGPLPVTVLNYQSTAIKTALSNLLRKEQFDTIQIEGVHLVEYVPVIREACPSARILADWHNVESEIMKRYGETASSRLRKLMALRTAPLIERAENRLLRICNGHTVVSARERQKLLARAPQARIHVIPNGVDVASYETGPGNPVRRDILFVGSMDYHANIEAVTWFVREVWPSIRAAHPELVFKIVGRAPAPEVQSLASESVVVTGTVENVRSFYADALAVVVPLRVGGGTRLKILEAMAARVPVVSTELGAEGIDVQNGGNILLADTPAELAAAIQRIAGEPELSEKLKQEGHALVSRLYDWPIVGEQLYRVHCDLLGDLIEEKSI